MAVRISDRLINWASDIEPETIAQAERTAALPVIAGHVALMPDAHVGTGATVGSVIPTKGAILPSAVGVDIGCGMAAVELDVTASQLADDLNPLEDLIAQAIPAGLAKGHAHATKASVAFFEANPPVSELSEDLVARARNQFGSLGGGNHFFELCLDERDRVWVLLHAGSRGVGKTLADGHIKIARGLARDAMLDLEDLDLAWFVQGTPEFSSYIGDMLWAQRYALANRDAMLDAALRTVLDFLGFGRETDRVNCHHNYAQLEMHEGQELWITRKGAIRAGIGDRGLIPGSMGAASYIVEGRGNPLSFSSCSHGAGRRMSRNKARDTFTAADLVAQMGDRVWQKDQAAHLVDEIPSAYKSIAQVMADQADLVHVVHTLRQVLNYKGPDSGFGRRKQRR